MGFDIDKFDSTEFVERTRDIPVPTLKKFFGKDEKPTWTVRCISGPEMFLASEQAQAAGKKDRMKYIETVLDGTLSKNEIERLKVKAGIPPDPEMDSREFIFRKALLVYGSVNPVCPEQVAVKLGHKCGEVFKVLTNHILELYHYGYTPGEL